MCRKHVADRIIFKFFLQLQLKKLRYFSFDRGEREERKIRRNNHRTGLIAFYKRKHLSVV